MEDRLRFAFKVAYDGSRFHGSARQPGIRTVEGEILKALKEMGALPPGRPLLLCASRTDRGVSARSNAFVVEVGLDDPPKIARALTGRVQGLWVYAWSRVDPTENPRRWGPRTYRYLLPKERFDKGRLSEILRIFVGEHDFRSFSRPLAGRPTIVRVDSIRLLESSHLLEIETEAPFFLWEMVRRIVGASLLAVEGRRKIEEIERALRGEDVPPFPPAPAEGLVLWEVGSPVSWKILSLPPSLGHPPKEESDRLLVRSRILNALSQRARMSPLFEEIEELGLRGAWKFDEGKYVEAHEDWEEIWKRFLKLHKTQEAAFVQGAILVAASFESARRGHLEGARRQLSKGLRRLLSFPPPEGFPIERGWIEALLDLHLESLSLYPHSPRPPPRPPPIRKPLPLLPPVAEERKELSFVDLDRQELGELLTLVGSRRQEITRALENLAESDSPDRLAWRGLRRVEELYEILELKLRAALSDLSPSSPRPPG